MKSWPIHKAFFWQEAPSFRIFLTVVASICCYRAGGLRGLSVLASSVICIFLLALSGFLYFIPRTRLPFIQFLLLNLTIAMITICCCMATDIRTDPHWFGRQVHAHQATVLCIEDVKPDVHKPWRLLVNCLYTIDTNGEVASATGTGIVYVSVPGNAHISLRTGDTLISNATWQKITNRGNPFEFDYKAYCAYNNLYYSQLAKPDNLLRYGVANKGHLSIVARIHQWCMVQLDRNIQDMDTRALIQSMLLGDEVNLDPDLRNLYANTGIIQIIAISGANITAFFMLIAALLFWIRNNKYRWVKYVGAFPLVWMYVLVTGAEPSAVRAGILFSIIAVGITLGKSRNALNELFATGVILLIAKPMWLFSLGFQLSFAAVLSLILFYNPVYKLLSFRYWWIRKLWGAIAASLAAEFLIAPLVAFYFHSFPLCFLPANIVAFLFMNGVLATGMAIICFTWWPSLDHWISIALTSAVHLFHIIIGWLQAMNPESFHFLQISLPQLLLVYATLGGIATAVIRRRKWGVFVALSTSCLLMLSLCVDATHALNQQKLIVYNSSGANEIDLIAGNHFQIVSNGVWYKGETDDAQRLAHTGWRAWHKIVDTLASPIFMIGGKSVLILNHSPSREGRFHVDYVVINNEEKASDPISINSIFSPTLIVAGGLNKRRQIDRWAKMADTAHIAMHIVARDGAFVLSGQL